MEAETTSTLAMRIKAGYLRTALSQERTRRALSGAVAAMKAAMTETDGPTQVLLHEAIIEAENLLGEK
jgi:hypothetical protein